MRLSSASLPKASGGMVVNLLSNDVVRFELVFTGLHYIWITPIQVIIISYLMYQTVGWASLLGVFFMIMVTVPFQGSMMFLEKYSYIYEIQSLILLFSTQREKNLRSETKSCQKDRQKSSIDE